MPHFALRFPADQLTFWANRYDPEPDHVVEHEIGPFMRYNGYLTKERFLTLARWKSARPQRHCAKNPERFVGAVTRVALSATDEQLRIEVLTLLCGVAWPTASVILHFGSHDRYPILDYRALWSLGVEAPPYYDFDFWWAYVEATRALAATHNLTMRQLDRALWWYSLENQRSA